MTARRVAAASALLLLLGFFLYEPEPRFEPAPNRVEISERARRLHADAIVVDLHVDSLLWPRDLREAGRGGHVDFPRMRAGGLDAVAFTIPTRFFGVAGLKAFHDRWPFGSWFSPWRRLSYQLSKTKPWVEDVDARVAVSADPDAIRENHDEGRLTVFHGIEGAHALGADLERVHSLRARGVAFLGPVHLADNAYGGSSSGAGGGLTERGRALLRAMNDSRLLVDLAHASPRTFDEALALTKTAPIVSHTGVRAVHDSWRNLSDAQIRAVAARGGVIGIMLAPPALRRRDLEEAMRHLEHVIETGGEDTAAIGSDFDGYVDPPIDVSGLPALTELMLRRGFSEERVRKILGENVLRVLEEAR